MQRPTTIGPARQTDKLETPYMLSEGVVWPTAYLDSTGKGRDCQTNTEYVGCFRTAQDHFIDLYVG